MAKVAARRPQTKGQKRTCSLLSNHPLHVTIAQLYFFCSFMFCISLLIICIFCGPVHCRFVLSCVFISELVLFCNFLCGISKLFALMYFSLSWICFCIFVGTCLLVSNCPLHVTIINGRDMNLLVLTDRLGC